MLHLGHCLRVQHIQNRVRDLLKILVSLTRLYLADEDDILFIDSRDEIFCLCREQAPHRLQSIVVFFILCFDQIYYSFYIRLDMELLRAVVDINEKKVVEKKVLDEVILYQNSFLVMAT